MSAIITSWDSCKSVPLTKRCKCGRSVLRILLSVLQYYLSVNFCLVSARGLISHCLFILFSSVCTGDCNLKCNYLDYTLKAKYKVYSTVIHSYGFCHFKLIGCISPSIPCQFVTIVRLVKVLTKQTEANYVFFLPIGCDPVYYQLTLWKAQGCLVKQYVLTGFAPVLFALSHQYMTPCFIFFFA